MICLFFFSVFLYLVADYQDGTYLSTRNTLASKVSCLHSIKFAAQLQRFYGPKGEHYQEKKPVLLHLVGLDKNDDTDSDDENDHPSNDNTRSDQSTEEPKQQQLQQKKKSSAKDKKSVARDHRAAVASMSMEETCRIFAFIIHSIQAPWPLPPSED